MTWFNIRHIGPLTLCALLAAALLVSPDAMAKKKKKKGKKAKAAEVEKAPEGSEDLPEGAGNGSQNAARQRYSNGKALYDEGKFAEALLEFQAAYDAKPHPVVLKSIAECQVQAGELLTAIATLEKYLADPEAPDKAVVEARIGELKRTPSNVNITSEPAGAKIEVAGVDTGEVTPATLELAPGEYAVRLVADGTAPVQKNLTVILGQEAELAVDMAAEAPVAEEPEEAVDDPFGSEGDVPQPELGPEKSGPPAAFWAMAAVTGVGLVTGTVFGTMALADEEDYKDDPTQAKKEAGRRDAIIADVSFGLAGAAAIAGTVIFVVHRKKAKKESAKINVLPVAGQNGAGLTATVQF